MKSKKRGLACWLAIASAGFVHTVSASEFVILPVFGNQQDTGFQFGAAGIWEQAPEPDALAANIFFVLTQNGQRSLATGLRLPGPVAERQDAIELGIRLSQFPNEFFGYRTTFLAEGERYDEESVTLSAGWSYPLNTNWRAQATGLAAWADVTFDNPSSPLLDNVAWTTGGTAQALEFELSRDTTDDNGWPTQGSRFISGITTGQAEQQAFSIFQQEATRYWGMSPQWRNSVLALGAQWQFASADTPFIFMPSLNGTQWMRGLDGAQYRNLTTVSAQAEARIPLSQRFATTVFTHVGQIGADPGEWTESALKTGGGLGFRYSISSERRLNIRVDLGWVDGRGGAVINFGEAF
ncbi:BamA/TamA family outer membrane protein [Salinispirillum marinum]|uniref:BamA/TamA family outer membrane protein n=2 Tax=Saccharospirillaceae TaxID=255527 RepID=A0ABV8BJ40_9GAMM